MFGPNDHPNPIPINASEKEVQASLEAFRPVYLRSLARINGEDEEWNAKKEFLETKIYRLIKSFTENDQPTKAVLIIGQAQAIASELDQPRLNVAQFESLRNQFVDYEPLEYPKV